ncbi:TMV resistance protein N-like [Apium graveolens]|uniref:TMV resistance protein N-like n=1 Tax=Apium graveolens TaxID=4045 RepID=UPI003D79368F
MAASASFNQNLSSSPSPPLWDDDPELLGGEVIPRALPQAIQQSKTYIVVLSENYASSSIIMVPYELEEILRCYKRPERLVIPVFYYIDPTVDRHQVKSFKEAFEKHQTRVDLGKVEKWRLTLKEVADFSGYHIYLKTGLGGFKNRTRRLQQQLLDNVLKRKDIIVNTADQGIELIRARICSTKVLVVFDDLDDPKPLKFLEGSFVSGSMVIITTRNEDLLDRIELKAKYKVNKMDKYESLRLFTRHAFGEDKIGEDKKLHTLTELSKEVLKYAGGLPLALQVFGSTLLNESRMDGNGSLTN